MLVVVELKQMMWLERLVMVEKRHTSPAEHLKSNSLVEEMRTVKFAREG